MLTANGNGAALCLCLFCLCSGDWLRNSLNSKQMKDSSVRKCFYFGNPKSYLRHMWRGGKHSKNFEKKKTDFDIKVEGTTGRPTVNQSQLQMLAPNQWWMVANVAACTFTVNTSHIIQYQHITSFKFVLQHIRRHHASFRTFRCGF